MVIQSRVQAPDWTDDSGGGLEAARCLSFAVYRDPDGVVRNDGWFQDAESALSVCNGDWEGGTPCPMRATCLRVALINNEQYGVWGGLTDPQRRWIRRNIPRDKWNDDTYLRQRVPPPTYFKDLGDEDPDAEA